ncbi:M23 family metallopeptidase [Anaeropeptidivorans aminofermentans]|uniref:M23 family metallopeptidase n=1 Tax=Anaeropeptidivorans aminofermentans TaxID=2934315 RepID=UPI002B2182A0|nr:M23 family metallopeptidase [Anaeropeptidivorans aminofermentans]MBE6011551.1 M23 family metallopeptidase [Lachnospiraceae bacterium]
MYKWINPLTGIITSGFGERINPVLNKKELHNGIDIAADEGTGVLAVQNGTVTRIYRSSTYGNAMEYKTDNGYDVMYAHLKKVLVKEGDRVEKGQIVALSGKTGLVTGPHLHYTLIKDGKLIDPITFVELPYTADVKANLTKK